MVFSTLLIALAAAVAYFHYTQGFFSAAISAILVTFAAVVAIGFHENVAAWMVGTKVTEEAAAIALCALFGGSYIILRFAFDYLVPGNVRLPVMVDKIGAGAMGLWAGLLSTGVLAIAAQTLPFGPDVGYYSRYDIEDRKGQFMGSSQQQDVTLFDVTKSPTMNVGEESHLLLWQDDLVMELAHKVSDGGSLSGSQPLAAVHPDYLAELFGQRIGIQVGAQHALISRPMPPLSVVGVYTQPQILQVDGEIQSLRSPDEQVAQTLQPADRDQQAILIVRTVISQVPDAADSDSLLRLSAGSIRLVAGHDDDSGIDYADYHPVATLDRRGIAVACRVDDFLFTPLEGSRTIDLIFMVDKDRVFGVGAKDPPYHLAKGTFLEVKRYASVDLSDKKVDFGPPTNRDKTGLLRKTDVEKELITLGPQQLVGVAPPTPPQAGASTGELGLTFQDISVSTALFAPLDVRKPDMSGLAQLPNGLSGSWQDRAFKSLSIPIAENCADLAQPGTNTIDHFYTIEGQVMVQVHLTIPQGMVGKKAWDWGRHTGDLELADSAEMTYKPFGAWVRATSKSQDYIVASVNNNAQGGLYQIEAQASKAKPVDVWFAFIVPKGVKLQELRLSGTAVLEDLGFKAEEPPASQPSSSP